MSWAGILPVAERMDRRFKAALRDQRATQTDLLRSILAETDLIMAVDGYPPRADLTRDALRRTCTCHHG